MLWCSGRSPRPWGVANLWPGTAPLIPPMEPPPALDYVGMFADDGQIAGQCDEILRVAHHLRTHVPRTGLSFGKLQVVAANPEDSVLDPQACRDAGCVLVADGNLEVMRAPVGSEAWARQYVADRAKATVQVYDALASLESSHVAFYLARYQAGRTNYIVRTSPPPGLCVATRSPPWTLASGPSYARGPDKV